MINAKPEKTVGDMKICFAASSGGHLKELMSLEPLMDRYEAFVLTEKVGSESGIGRHRTYYLSQINRREIGFAFKFVKNTVKSLKVYAKEQPDMVISTGALATVPICLIARFCGKKLVFIESVANVTEPTATGKLMYRFADRFYVQWEEMLEVYPDAIFKGTVI